MATELGTLERLVHVVLLRSRHIKDNSVSVSILRRCTFCLCIQFFILVYFVSCNLKFTDAHLGCLQLIKCTVFFIIDPRQANLCLRACNHDKFAHAKPFGGVWDLAFCLKVPHDSLPV